MASVGHSGSRGRPEDGWPVSKCSAVRVLQNGRREVLVHWKDYPDELATWEPESPDLMAKLIPQYYQQRYDSDGEDGDDGGGDGQEGDIFKVEKILEYREVVRMPDGTAVAADSAPPGGSAKVVEVLIKWRHYKIAESTWEPLDNVIDLDGLSADIARAKTQFLKKLSADRQSRQRQPLHKAAPCADLPASGPAGRGLPTGGVNGSISGGSGHPESQPVATGAGRRGANHRNYNKAVFSPSQQQSGSSTSKIPNEASPPANGSKPLSGSSNNSENGINKINNYHQHQQKTTTTLNTTPPLASSAAVANQTTRPSSSRSRNVTTSPPGSTSRNAHPAVSLPSDAPGAERESANSGAAEENVGGAAASQRLRRAAMAAGVPVGAKKGRLPPVTAAKSSAAPVSLSLLGGGGGGERHIVADGDDDDDDGKENDELRRQRQRLPVATGSSAGTVNTKRFRTVAVMGEDERQQFAEIAAVGGAAGGAGRVLQFSSDGGGEGDSFLDLPLSTIAPPTASPSSGRNREVWIAASSISGPDAPSPAQPRHVHPTPTTTTTAAAVDMMAAPSKKRPATRTVVEVLRTAAAGEADESGARSGRLAAVGGSKCRDGSSSNQVSHQQTAKRVRTGDQRIDNGSSVQPAAASGGLSGDDTGGAVRRILQVADEDGSETGGPASSWPAPSSPPASPSAVGEQRQLMTAAAAATEPPGDRRRRRGSQRQLTSGAVSNEGGSSGKGQTPPRSGSCTAGDTPQDALTPQGREGGGSGGGGGEGPVNGRLGEGEDGSSSPATAEAAGGVSGDGDMFVDSSSGSASRKSIGGGEEDDEGTASPERSTPTRRHVVEAASNAADKDANEEDATRRHEFRRNQNGQDEEIDESGELEEGEASPSSRSRESAKRRRRADTAIAAGGQLPSRKGEHQGAGGGSGNGLVAAWPLSKARGSLVAALKAFSPHKLSDGSDTFDSLPEQFSIDGGQSQKQQSTPSGTAGGVPHQNAGGANRVAINWAEALSDAFGGGLDNSDDGSGGRGYIGGGASRVSINPSQQQKIAGRLAAVVAAGNPPPSDQQHQQQSADAANAVVNLRFAAQGRPPPPQQQHQPVIYPQQQQQHQYHHQHVLAAAAAAGRPPPPHSGPPQLHHPGTQQSPVHPMPPSAAQSHIAQQYRPINMPAPPNAPPRHQQLSPHLTQQAAMLAAAGGYHVQHHQATQQQQQGCPPPPNPAAASIYQLAPPDGGAPRHPPAPARFQPIPGGPRQPYEAVYRPRHPGATAPIELSFSGSAAAANPSGQQTGQSPPTMMHPSSGAADQQFVGNGYLLPPPQQPRPASVHLSFRGQGSQAAAGGMPGGACNSAPPSHHMPVTPLSSAVQFAAGQWAVAARPGQPHRPLAPGTAAAAAAAAAQYHQHQQQVAAAAAAGGTFDGRFGGTAGGATGYGSLPPGAIQAMFNSGMQNAVRVPHPPPQQQQLGGSGVGVANLQQRQAAAAAARAFAVGQQQQADAAAAQEALANKGQMMMHPPETSGGGGDGLLGSGDNSGRKEGGSAALNSETGAMRKHKMMSVKELLSLNRVRLADGLKLPVQFRCYCTDVEKNPQFNGQKLEEGLRQMHADQMRRGRQKLLSPNRAVATNLITCGVCGTSEHVQCALFWIDTTKAHSNLPSLLKHVISNFTCISCRMLSSEPYRPVERILGLHGFVPGKKSMFTITANLPRDFSKLAAAGHGIQVRCVAMNQSYQSYTSFPHSCKFHVKARQRPPFETLTPPGPHRKRKDAPIDIPIDEIGTSRTLVLAVECEPRTDVKLAAAEECMMFALVHVGPQYEPQTILRDLQQGSTLSVERGSEVAAKILRMANTAAEPESDGELDGEGVEIVDALHSVSLRCPVTLSRIEVPARGVHCSHVQCFDGAYYVQSQGKFNAHVARWRCAVCRKSCLPHELIIDGFVRDILDKTTELDRTVFLSVDEEDDSVVSWKVTEKDEEEGGETADGFDEVKKYQVLDGAEDAVRQAGSPGADVVLQAPAAANGGVIEIDDDD